MRKDDIARLVAIQGFKLTNGSLLSIVRYLKLWRWSKPSSLTPFQTLLYMFFVCRGLL